jgi:hypothetical protein
MGFTVLSPTAILGYGFPEASFKRGLACEPDLIAVDAGSVDPGPYYLGAGKSFTARAAVKRDLELMLVAGIERGIPLVVGSAGGAGARPHLQWNVDIVTEIARERDLQFRLGTIAADITPQQLQQALAEGRIKALTGAPQLTAESIDQSSALVGQMGTEPIEAALEAGCDVIIAGRAYDPAVFAALPIVRGYDRALALHLGKILECATIAALPGSGADCALGILERDHFVLQALSETRRFTPTSVAAHSLYEKSDPYLLPGPGGALDLSGVRFEDIGDGRVAVYGSRFQATDQDWIKVEGARAVGHRSVSIAGARDPAMIADIDAILEQVRKRVHDQLPAGDNQAGQLYFHVYGKHGVMGEAEPARHSPAHELGIVIEAVAPDPGQADTLCSLARSTLLHYGYPGRLCTGGNLAFPFSPSDIRAGQVYTFSAYHLMQADPGELFPAQVTEVTP